MASSRATQNGPDWKDVARALEEFQAAWEAIPVITVTLKGKGRQGYLCWTAALTGEECASGEAPVLGYASVNMLTGNTTATDAALLLLLYELDRDVYRREQGMQTKTA